MRLKALRNHVEIEQVSLSVMTVRFEGIKADWDQWFMLTGDRHHDNAHSDEALERRQLERAMERDALIFDIGDLFDAMQGKFDKRSNYGDLKKEHKVAAYFDSLVDTSAAFYKPYADHWALLGRGNHESSVSEKMGTDLTDRLAAALRRERGCGVVAGGYHGWVRFQFRIHQTRQCSIRLSYHHGSGGASLMSFGTLSVRRQASYLPEADIVVNGHNHDGYIVPMARERLSEGNCVSRDVAWYLRTMTYKDEWTNQPDGWAVRKGGGPKPLGCIWGRFHLLPGGDIGMEFMQDVN